MLTIRVCCSSIHEVTLQLFLSVIIQERANNFQLTSNIAYMLPLLPVADFMNPIYHF